MVKQKILDFFNSNQQATELFMLLVFFAQKNMVGGLSEYDDMAISKIKSQLKGILQFQDDADLLNYLTEIISNSDYDEISDIIEKDNLGFIGEQNPLSLSKVLGVYLEDSVGLLIEIPLDYKKLNIDNILEFAKNNHPSTMTNDDFKVSIMNPWKVISLASISPNPYEKIDTCIMAFTINKTDTKSFYFLKGLFILKKIIDVYNKDNEVIQEETPKETIDLGQSNVITVFKSIFSINSKKNKKQQKLNDSPNLKTSEVEGKRSLFGSSSEKKNTKNQENNAEPSTMQDNVSPLHVNINNASTIPEGYNHLGFFDTNQGFFFQLIMKK